MPVAHKLSTTDRESIVNLYEAGWSIRFIAKTFKVTHSTVWYHLDKANVEMRPAHIVENSQGRIEHKVMDKTVFLYRNLEVCHAEKLRIIAKQTGVGADTVRRRLRLAGVLPNVPKKKSRRRAKRVHSSDTTKIAA